MRTFESKNTTKVLKSYKVLFVIEATPNSLLFEKYFVSRPYENILAHIQFNHNKLTTSRP